MRNEDVPETGMYHYSSMIRRDCSLKQHETVEITGTTLILILTDSQWLVEFLKRSTQN